jgi:chitinase
LSHHFRIPLYGRAFEETAGLQQPFTGVGTGTWGPGVYDYKALPFAGATVTEDTKTGSSYSYDPTKKELGTLSLISIKEFLLILTSFM